MEFKPLRIKHVDTGTLVNGFVLDSKGASEKPTFSGDYTEMMLDGKKRKLSSKVLNMMVEFGMNNDERQRRTELGHDCFAFALACRVNDPLTDISFKKGEKKIQTSWQEKSEFEIDSIKDGLDCEPGGVVYTGLVSHKSPEWKDPKLAKYHFMVRASCDDGEPVYVSKFGFKGPVVAHSLDGSLGFYPSNFIGEAADFKIIPKELS